MLEYRPVDETVYRSELLPWLPPRILDAHVHVSLRQRRVPVSPERLKGNWAMEVGVSHSWEDLRATYKMLFPGVEVFCLAFGGVFKEFDTDVENDRVLSGIKDPANRARGLFVSRPEDDPARIRQALQDGFSGVKPYPDLAASNETDCSIFDFLPRAHLKVLDEHSAVVVLHISRPGRIGDPDNIREVLEIADSYLNVRLVVAHVGRAFCLPTARKGLPHFTDRPGVLFDCSANLNPDVFEYFFDALGPERLLFGSDLPITLMRGVREYVGERYINFTDAPYSWNTDRKSPEDEARYTFFLYEELRALISALGRVGMGKAEMEAVLYSNAARMLGIEDAND